MGFIKLTALRRPTREELSRGNGQEDTIESLGVAKVYGAQRSCNVKITWSFLRTVKIILVR